MIYACGELEDDERLASGVVGGVLSKTVPDAADPAVEQGPRTGGRCMASASLRPLFRCILGRMVGLPGTEALPDTLALLLLLATTPRPRVRGKLLDDAGALAKGISVGLEADAATAVAQLLSGDGASQDADRLPWPPT